MASKTKSICIPLTLYSKHIPSKLVTIKKDYLLFGHYDALEIGEDLFEDDGCDFTKLWEHSVENADLSDLKRNFSKQTLYALRTNNEEDCDDLDDKTFWKSNELPPFLFLCIIQTGNIQDLYKCRKSLKEDAITKYKINNNDGTIQVKCYSSLENNCIILAFRCDDFQKGLDVINTYHNKEESAININNEGGEGAGGRLEIQYTYTTIGFKSDYNSYNKLGDQKIELVHLYVIERSPGAAGNLYDQLEERIKDLVQKFQIPENQISLERQQIVGNDDELWVIKNIRWDVFLDLFLSQEKPLLAGGTEICEKYTYSIATHFMNEKNNLGSSQTKGADIDEKCIKIHKVLKELKRISDLGLNGALHNKRKGYYKSMMYIINSLEKFEYAYALTDHFNDYTYFMLYEPLLTMAEAILIATKMENLGISLRERITPKQIYSFLNSVNTITHHTTHSDRQFVQTPDFNAIIFETPAKLGAFYGALVNLEKKMLDSNKNMDYHFLIVPGLHEFVRVEDLFSGFLCKKRLCTIEIPEQQMFEPEIIIPVLMHETAHKTGSHIRLRELRYKSFLDVMSYMLSVDLIMFCMKEDDIDLQQEEVNITRLRNLIFPDLSAYASEENETRNSMRNDEMAKIKESEDANEIIEEIELDYDLLHTENIKNNISVAVDNFITGLPDNESILNMLWDIYSKHKEVDYDCFVEKLNQHLVYYINNREIGSRETAWKGHLFRSEFEDVLYIYREVYADVISIDILDIDINKYLKVVVKNDFTVFDASIYESVNIIRIAIVTLVMTEVGRWETEDFRSDSPSDKIEEIKKRVMDVILCIYGKRELKTQVDAPFVFRHKAVWDSIVQYMIACMKKLEATMNEEVIFLDDKRKKEALRDDIRRVYKSIEDQKENGVDKVLKEIETKIE